MTEQVVLERPTPEVIEAERRRAGLTQRAAAALVHGSLRGWQQWEAGDRRMPLAVWELFLLKVRGVAITEAIADAMVG